MRLRHSKKEMSEANFEKIFQEIKAESNHRSAAILLVINVKLILDKKSFNIYSMKDAPSCFARTVLSVY